MSRDGVAPAPRPQPSVALADRLRRFQATVPGIYAWGLTVAPGAFARNAPWAAQLAVFAALAVLFLPVIAPARLRERAAIASLWLFIAACVVSWGYAHPQLSSAKLDSTRAVLGSLGWLLFALAQAAPPLTPAPGAVALPLADAASPQGRAYERLALGIAVLGSLALFAMGWHVEPAERAVLVRLVLAVCAIALVAGATELALARRERRRVRSRRTRLRRAVPYVVLLAVLLASGALIRWSLAR